MSEIVNHAVKPVFLSKVQREVLHKQEEIAEQNRHREQNQSTKRKRYCDEDVKEENSKILIQRYLLPKKPRTLPRKKSRFCPDWDVGEDTSGDINYEAPLLFGRGLRGGIDTSLQKKQVIERVHEDQKHWSKKKLEEMRERDWRIFQEDHSISYKWWRSRFIRPMRNSKESNLNPNLLKAVDRLRYRTPTPIQMAAIPLGLQNCDVIGIAETGSGKTAAFVLPMLNYISGLPPKTDNNEAQGPLAVVLAPTCELAQQIERETVRLSRYLDIKVVSIVGGLSIAEQGFKISQGCEVVIATPGRLIDCLERRYAVLNRCTYVVLDEDDRMIDLGFESQIVDVLEAMPCSNLKPENDDELLDEKKNYRTTYMFTATMSPGVEKLARKILRNPVVVTVGSSGHANHRISQQVIMMKKSQKLHKLKKITDEIGGKTAIVFVKDKKSADFVSSSLNRDKDRCSVTAFHSGMSQERRERSLEGFRTRKYGVLVATDVASRGIDVPDVAYVINYDMPDSIDLYTHRIGRTGRAGKTGIAITFLTLSDTKVFYDLKQKLIQSNSPVPHELARHEDSNLKPGTIPDRALIF